MPSVTTSTIHVTDVDGVPWEGTGENLAHAVRDLDRRHAAGRPAQQHLEEAAASETADEAGSTQEIRWKLTPKGQALVAALRRAAAVAEEAAGAGAAEEPCQEAGT